jgi:RNA polymerase sigma-70 factor, ECF subfamily
VVTASEGYLVRAAKDGDAAAFEALLKPEYRTAFRLAFGMLHDIQEAEDAAQEAAFKAWRRIGNLREDAGRGTLKLGQ